MPVGSTTIASAGGRVKGLHYDTAATGGHAAAFSFSVPNPPGGFQRVHWTVDGTLVAAGEDSLACPYKAVGVGKHTVTVMVLKSNGVSTNGSLTFAAIGGPLSYSVFNAESGVSVPAHDDNDIDHPFHLQYFDYTFAGSSTKPTGAQQPQCGLVASVLSQMDPGTTYAWTITGPGQNFATGLNGSTVFVTANGQSTPGEIKARLTYSYTDPTDSTLSGSALDDSEETPPQAKRPPMCRTTVSLRIDLPESRRLSRKPNRTKLVAYTRALRHGPTRTASFTSSTITIVSASRVFGLRKGSPMQPLRSPLGTRQRVRASPC